MKYTNTLLDELLYAIYGDSNDLNVDYDDMSINYNEVGDTYYRIVTYSNNEVKCIMVCASVTNEDGKGKVSGYKEVYVQDDFYDAIDYILENQEKIDLSLDRQIAQKTQQMRKNN